MQSQPFVFVFLKIETASDIVKAFKKYAAKKYIRTPTEININSPVTLNPKSEDRGSIKFL